ncbi:protein white-like isoform X2 [Oscarella lobularis]|uniref:protein white-like isoform X2 n=1 Tax=Oscarella lobularis TaxID=121494 RepID=UPI003313EFDB
MESSLERGRPTFSGSESSLRFAVANSLITNGGDWALEPKTQRRSFAIQRQASSPDHTVSISWKNVTVTARTAPSLRERIKGMEGREKVILREVSGIARPGQLIALMGASGAGKTTLLNVLSGHGVGKLNVEGSVTVNGKEALGRNLGSLSAYIQQEDLFVGTLRVVEHLKFHAFLRMGSQFTSEEKVARVEQVLSEMGLRKCKDTIIGVPGKIKGISGGEKKRLAFATEILTNPPVLFADEPTSGLDSFMAESVVNILQEMAESHRTILCTIHQPSSEVFALFDRLILLAEGRLAFHGSSSEAMKFFGSVGYPCPENFNPADFYVHTLAVVPGIEKECMEKIESITESFESSEGGLQLRENLKSEAATSDADEEKVKFSINRKTESYTASYFTQFRFVLWRAWLANARDPTAIRAKLIQALVISILLGLMYLQTDYDQSRLQNIPGAMTFILIQLSIGNLIAVLQTFPLETPVFLRDHRSSLYRTSAYYISKAFADVPFQIGQTLLFSVVSYFMIGLNSGADRFFIFFGSCLLISFIAISLGYAVSAYAPTVAVALAFAPLTFLPFVLFGGFFIRSGTACLSCVDTVHIMGFLRL